MCIVQDHWNEQGHLLIVLLFIGISFPNYCNNFLLLCSVLFCSVTNNIDNQEHFSNRDIHFNVHTSFFPLLPFCFVKSVICVYINIHLEFCPGQLVYTSKLEINIRLVHYTCIYK